MLRRNSGSDLRKLNGSSEYGCALKLGAGFDDVLCSADGGVAGNPTVPGVFGARAETSAAGGVASAAFCVCAVACGAGAGAVGATGGGGGGGAALFERFRLCASAGKFGGIPCAMGPFGPAFSPRSRRFPRLRSR